MRIAAKVDANHAEVVKEFRKLGWYVLNVSQLKNCCDIIVSKAGRVFAIEIKDGNKPPSQRKLTEGELRFQKEWQGNYSIVESIDDVRLIDGADF